MPMRTLLSTTIRITEMSAMAKMVPRSMLSMLRWERWAKIMLTPDAAVAIPGALACSQSCARTSSARSSPPDRLAAAAVSRVADLETSMRSLRSTPKGSENSYSRRYWAPSSASSGSRWKSGSSPFMFRLRRFMMSGNACTCTTSGCSRNHSEKASTATRYSGSVMPPSRPALSENSSVSSPVRFWITKSVSRRNW